MVHIMESRNLCVGWKIRREKFVGRASWPNSSLWLMEWDRVEGPRIFDDPLVFRYRVFERGGHPKEREEEERERGKR